MVCGWKLSDARGWNLRGDVYYVIFMYVLGQQGKMDVAPKSCNSWKRVSDRRGRGYLGSFRLKSNWFLIGIHRVIKLDWKSY